MPPKTKLPDQTWSVTKEEKAQIVELGRVLTKTIYDFAKTKGRFHVKIAVGACQYFADLIKQKGDAVTDDLMIVQEAIEKHNLGNNIVEPFTETEEVIETKEQQITRLKEHLAKLESEVAPVTETPVPADAPKTDPDVEDASIAPENRPVSVEASAPAAPVDEAQA